MALTQIDGATQIKDSTIPAGKLSFPIVPGLDRVNRNLTSGSIAALAAENLSTTGYSFGLVRIARLRRTAGTSVAVLVEVYDNNPGTTGVKLGELFNATAGLPIVIGATAIYGPRFDCAGVSQLLPFAFFSSGGGTFWLRVTNADAVNVGTFSIDVGLEETPQPF